MPENKHYYTPQQELAMELKRQQMIALINSCDTKKEQEIMLAEIKNEANNALETIKEHSKLGCYEWMWRNCKRI